MNHYLLRADSPNFMHKNKSVKLHNVSSLTPCCFYSCVKNQALAFFWNFTNGALPGRTSISLPAAWIFSAAVLLKR